MITVEKSQGVTGMNFVPRRCECIWCSQVFFSTEYYKYGTCSSCLITKIVTPAPKLAELLGQAEAEARKELQALRKKAF
jgi:hypothetical protein